MNTDINTSPDSDDESGDFSDSEGNLPGETWQNPSSEEFKEILLSARRVAVVGLSTNPARPSNGVAAYLKDQGFEIVPINPKADEVFGLKCYPNLASAPGKFDIVNIFRKPENALEAVQAAIKIGVPTIWLQEGVISPEAFALGRAAGRTMIMDRCILKEHSRLMSDS